MLLLVKQIKLIRKSKKKRSDVEIELQVVMMK